MKTRELERLAWGTDAGFYRLLPQGLFDHVCRWLYRLHVRLTYKV